MKSYIRMKLNLICTDLSVYLYYRNEKRRFSNWDDCCPYERETLLIRFSCYACPALQRFLD